MVAEQQYRYLVDQVYWVDNLRSENSPKENEVYYYSNKNPKLGQFQVLKTKDNTSNGMQFRSGLNSAKVVGSQLVTALDYAYVN